VRNTLSAALREALKLEYLTLNVASLVDEPNYTPTEKTVWRHEQVSQFLRSAKSHRYYPLFLLLLCYGLRRGEALGLRWQDVDFDNDTIAIRQQIQSVDGKIQALPVKNRFQRACPATF
jgi:integrase